FIEYLWSTEAGLRMFLHKLNERRECGAMNDCVRIQQTNIFSGRLRDAEIVSPCESFICTVVQNAEARAPFFRRASQAVISAGVVRNDHFNWKCKVVGKQTIKAIDQHRAGVVIENDNGQRDRALAHDTSSLGCAAA